MEIYTRNKLGLVFCKTTFLALMVAGCQTDDSADDSANTGSETAAGEGDGDGDPSGGGHSTGEPGDGDPSEAGDGDGDGDGPPGRAPSEEGDGDGEPAGDGDGEGEGDGDGDGDGEGEGQGEGEGDGDGEGEALFPMPGDPCDPLENYFACVPGDDGATGSVLRCVFAQKTWAMTEQFDDQCHAACDTKPINACGGVGAPATCLCEKATRQSCDEATLGCSGPDEVTLCHDGEVVSGPCPQCRETDGGYYSCDG